MKKIVCTVTNDLSYDQRMIRICSSLVNRGYQVLLVGRKTNVSVPLLQQTFRQKRLYCYFRTGKAFYFEYNIRLFLFLLFRKMDCICAIDLDTIVPCFTVSVFKNIPRVYDAHELFCEMKEVVTRPRIHNVWKKVEKFTVPRFSLGYTVNDAIAAEFHAMYGVRYRVIRNLPVLQPLSIPEKTDRYILYQGAVNEGRSFETLIPAMKQVPCKLIICGDGNFLEQAKALVKLHRLDEKVIFRGKFHPADLRRITLHATVGLTLFENTGKSNYLSLANRFFDYIHGGIPQLCVDYPAYRQINNEYNVALLTSELTEDRIAHNLNRLLNEARLYQTLQQNCIAARERLSWQNEEGRLFEFYEAIFRT